MPSPFFDLKKGGSIMDMKNVDDRDVYETTLAALNTSEWGYEVVTKYPKDLLLQLAGRVALNRMGIDCIFEGNITKDKLGYAIGKKVEEETGVYFGNIFDRESVKRGVMQYGCKRALQEMGFDDEPQTIEGVAHAVGRLAARKIEEEIGLSVEGPIMQAVKVNAAYMRVAQRDNVLTLAGKAMQTPRKMGKKAESNRRRQATYRATHGRYWEDK